MNHFRTDNTDGYDVSEIAALNAAFDELTPNDGDPTPIADRKSWCDYVAETILFAFDQGHRGEELIRECRKVGI